MSAHPYIWKNVCMQNKFRCRNKFDASLHAMMLWWNAGHIFYSKPKVLWRSTKLSFILTHTICRRIYKWNNNYIHMQMKNLSKNATPFAAGGTLEVLVIILEYWLQNLLVSKRSKTRNIHCIYVYMYMYTNRYVYMGIKVIIKAF